MEHKNKVLEAVRYSGPTRWEPDKPRRTPPRHFNSAVLADLVPLFTPAFRIP